jgi:hypothetical protein
MPYDDIADANDELVWCPLHDDHYSPQGYDPHIGTFLACGHSLAEVNERLELLRHDLGLADSGLTWAPSMRACAESSSYEDYQRRMNQYRHLMRVDQLQARRNRG